MDASETLTVALCGPGADVERLSSAMRAAQAGAPGLSVAVSEIAVPDRGEDWRDALEKLGAARLVVVAACADAGWSADLRQLCLVSHRLSGHAPVVAIVAGADAARRAEVASGWRNMAEQLGIASPTALAVDLIADGPAALAAAVAHHRDAINGAREAAAGLVRMHLDPVAAGAAPSATVTGELIAGRPAPGMAVVLLPSATPATLGTVSSEAAVDGAAWPRLRLTLDRSVAGGDAMLASAEQRPEQADQVVAHVVWFGRKPMLPGRVYGLRIGGQTSTVQVSTLKHKVDPVTLNPIAARRLEQGAVGLCNVSFADPMVFDVEGPGGDALLPARRFLLEDRNDGRVVGIGDVVFTLRRATNIHWQALAVDKVARASLKSQRPGCLWFTGLSGSGKSTVASLLEKRLNAMGRHTYTLDGDNVRHGLNRDLGFTDADRVENIRRVAEVSRLLVDAGLLVMVSFISPFRAERRMARALFPQGEFLEIFVDTPIDVCEQRDPKGLYKKARAGQLKNFTGIDSPYEPPETAEIRLPGGSAAPEELVERILDDLKRRAMI